MADFEAPVGPPPPKVPDGWVARWNEQYKEWYVRSLIHSNNNHHDTFRDSLTFFTREVFMHSTPPATKKNE